MGVDITLHHGKQARQAAALVSGQGLASLAEAFVPMVMVRFLPMTEVGILSTIVFLYTMLATVFSSAFPHSIMYFLPTRTIDQRGAVARKVAWVMFLLGLAAGAVMLFFGTLAFVFPKALASITDRAVGGVSVIGPEGLKYLVVLSLMPLGDFPARMLPNLLVIEERARIAAIINALKSVISLAAILVPMLLHRSLWVIVTSYSLAGLSSGFFLLYYLYRLYPSSSRSVSCDVSVRKLFAFAVPMGINDTVMQLYNRVDLLLIGLVFPAYIVAQYRTGAWQIPMVTHLAFCVGAVYAPYLRRLFSRGEGAEAIAIWKMTICKVALFTAPFGMIFIVGAEEIVTLLFTKDYLSAANVFRLYCLLTVGRVAAFGPVLVAAGRPGLIVRVAFLSLAANIVFSIPLVLTVGFIGPAIGTVAAFVIHVWGFCWCIGRAADVPLREVFPLRRFLGILGCSLFAGSCALAFKLFVGWGAGWKLAGIALIILLAFSVAATGLGFISRSDWSFLVRLPMRVRK